MATSIFAKAKAVPAAKTAAKKTKLEIAMEGVQSLAEIKAMIDSLAATAATLEADIKANGFQEFLNMETNVRPESFKGIDGEATCSVEMRKRGTNSALNEDEIKVLETCGLTPFKQIVTTEMFGINPKYAGDEKLMDKVSAAISKFVPEDFIVLQEERSKMVVDDACLDGAFKLTDAAQRKTALSICTTMALKPRLNAEYDMTKLAANVGALVNTTNDDIEEA
jgi:hypothetical protein